MSQEELAYIERYWAKELSQEEMQDFDIRYKTDAAFASQVDLFRESQEAIEVLGQKRLKESFRKAYQSENPPVKKLPTKWMLAAAAVIALLIAFALWPRNPQTPLSPEDLYASYYQFEALSLERGSSETDSLFSVANTAFNEKAFVEAIPLLEKLKDDTDFGRQEYALLHLGISYMEVGEWEKARLALNEISPESSFYTKAQWHLSLCLLAFNQAEQARPILKNLLEESKVYGKQAGEILERLSSQK